MKKTARQIKKATTKQERSSAAALGGRRTPGSGMLDEKGDGRVFGRFRIENKLSLSDKYRITSDVWKGIRDSALDAGERPVVQVRLSIPTGGYLDLAIVDLNDYQAMTDGSLTDLVGSFGEPAQAPLGYTVSVHTWLNEIRSQSENGAELFWLRNRNGRKNFSLVLMAYDEFVEKSPRLL